MLTPNKTTVLTFFTGLTALGALTLSSFTLSGCDSRSESGGQPAPAAAGNDSQPGKEAKAKQNKKNGKKKTAGKKTRVKENRTQREEAEFAAMMEAHDGNPNAVDEYGRPLVFSAVGGGKPVLLRKLVEKGAQIDVDGKVIDSVMRRERRVSLMDFAGMEGNAEVVCCLLEKGGDAKECGLSPLHLAVITGNAAEVQDKARRSTVDKADGSGKTALHWAASSGNKEIISVLLEAGASVRSEDAGKRTPLHYAAREGRNEAARLLLDQGADVNAKDQHDLTPLEIAMWGDDADEMVGFLLGNGAEAGPRALENAIRYGHVEAVRLLVDKGLDLNVSRVGGDTYLGLAAENGHTDIVRLLLKKGAYIDTPGYDGNYRRTPLAAAAENGHVEIVRLLLKGGAQVNPPSYEKPESYRLPLNCAACSGNVEIVKLMIGKGADINARGEGAITALHEAARAGHAEIVRILLEKGAKVDVDSMADRTPLHYACESGDVDSVRLLLEKGAKINRGECHGETPLYCAVRAASRAKSDSGWKRHEQVVRFLLEKGADANAADSRGNTPLSLAQSARNQSLVDLLKRYGAK